MQELLSRIQHHSDQQAFKQLYQLLFFRLYQFAYSYTGVRESAEEVVNDVFLRLWQKRSTLADITNLQVYLYVAVKNAALNRLRQQRRTLPLSLDDLHADHFHFTVTPEAGMISRELQQKVGKAIDELPPRCKLVFKLVKEDGLRYKEVAAILGVSVKTVDTQLFLALKKLSVSLLPVWSEYGPVTKD